MRHRRVFLFSVQDADAESLTFGCVADSLETATFKANQAGYKELTLLEVRELAAEEDSFFVNNEIYENPILGSAWLPVVDAFAASVKNLKIGDFFSLSFLARAYDFDESNGPYVQAMYEADGSLGLEVGSPQLIEAKGQSTADLLEFSGWHKPDDPSLPNYMRIFEPGWNIRHVVYFALLTLVVGFDIEASDIILPGGPGLKNFGQLGNLDEVSADNGLLAFGTGYGIPGLHFMADSVRALRAKSQGESLPSELSMGYPLSYFEIDSDENEPSDDAIDDDAIDDDADEIFTGFGKMTQTLMNENLQIPFVAEFLARQITVPQSWCFTTDGLFDRDTSYDFDRLEDWVKKPSEDCFQLAHGGHGINSWAITIRFAIGAVSFIGWSSYGGAYNDKEESLREWSNLASAASEVMKLGLNQRDFDATNYDGKPRPIRVVKGPMNEVRVEQYDPSEGTKQITMCDLAQVRDLVRVAGESLLRHV